ncbi:butyrophilin subfamily 2 member A1-like [Mauremys reevesii]|uniref:butyrophilin subfamily 2 member A1-like n=1 Tax=Mauremys reevesii TaxID=260615 RepID=UPI00193F139D|nr:butyrophilin subfamily 2 member A1-like [Mauremys reevesii]
MDFPKLVIDDKILMDILVLALMLIAIGIAFLIYHRKENIEPSKLLLAEIILLIIAVISLFGLNIIGTIFLTYRCSDSSQTSLGHLDMPKLVLLFSILLAIATISLFILIPFLIYTRCCLEKRKRNAAGGRCDNGEEESLEKSTEKMVELALETKILIGTVVVLIIIIIVLSYYCSRKRRRDPEEGNRRRDPEEGPLISAEEERLQKEKDELQAELRRIQTEKDELQREVDWRKALTYADDITLNPDTAHPNLSISEDKKFTHEPQPQKVPPIPERFDSTVCVLGAKGFSSEKHYWEVDVMSSADWDLGLAIKSIQRKGKLSLSPKEGFWALGLSGRDYWAKTDPWTRIMVKKKPKKIGVYLSYQEGQVTFFNVTDMSVLFTFNDCSFSGEVYPFFKNSHKGTSMRICSIREDE